MKTILWTLNTWVRSSPQRYAVARFRSYCVSKSNSNGNKFVGGPSSSKSNGTDDGKSLNHYHDTYQKLNNLDFITAAKILFTETPKKKRFGFDFHLVQFFFACMPSLAVYLVAQYARYDMKRMDAELEKKKQEEEAKAKAELEAVKQIELDAKMELKEVKVRLEKLEENVKEIADVAKSKSSTASPQRQEGSTGEEIRASGEVGISAEGKHKIQEEQKPKTQNGGASQDSTK